MNKTGALSVPTVVLAQVQGSVISEVIADESVVINLLNGHYHRLEGTASKLWEKLQTPTPFNEWLELARQNDPALDGPSLAQFGIDLLESELIAADPETVACLKDIAAEHKSDGTKRLTLESYDDMADLLLLDPIHEVGEHGWPPRPTNNS